MFLAAASNVPPAAMVLMFCAVFCIVLGLWMVLRGAGENKEARARRRLESHASLSGKLRLVANIDVLVRA